MKRAQIAQRLETQRDEPIDPSGEKLGGGARGFDAGVKEQPRQRGGEMAQSAGAAWAMLRAGDHGARAPGAELSGGVAKRRGEPAAEGLIKARLKKRRQRAQTIATRQNRVGGSFARVEQRGEIRGARIGPQKIQKAIAPAQKGAAIHAKKADLDEA